ncbi:MAG: hypothetical protein ACI8UO_004744 [Verrucomicrobiales bacterium]|jgi:hypothetical protein
MSEEPPPKVTVNKANANPPKLSVKKALSEEVLKNWKANSNGEKRSDACRGLFLDGDWDAGVQVHNFPALVISRVSFSR